MAFTAEEIGYLESQPVATLATVGADGQPDASPVGFEYDGTYLWVGGIDALKTRKFRNVRDGNTKVTLLVDDMPAVDPWTPRYLRIYGEAELVEREGRFGAGVYIRITPTVSWAFNLAAQPLSAGATTQRTKH